MLALQLLANGLVTGCSLGIVAMSFSLVYSTSRIFHVAHAGVYSLGGYVAWSLIAAGAPALVALPAAMAVCGVVGGLIQALLYRELARRRAQHLVVLIASLGMLAVIQNLIAAIYTPNILQFPGEWNGGRAFALGGLQLTHAQVLEVVAGFCAYAGVMGFAHRSGMGRRMRAVASNPGLADITGLEPEWVYVVVLAVASAIVAVPGVLTGFDVGLQPYGGITILLTATIAMIAGGVGSISGAFVLSLVLSMMQTLSLLVMPGEWSLGVTFFVFVVFMLFRPRGLFVAA